MSNEMDPETQAVLEEMKSEGHTFENQSQAPEQPKEAAQAPEPKEEPKNEPKGEEPKEEQPKEEGSEPAKEPDEKPEPLKREPRKPKEIPAWKAAIDKKNAVKEAEAKAKAEPKPEEPEAEPLKTKTDEDKPASSKTEALAQLKEKYKDTVTEEFLDDFAKLIPESGKLPPDVSEKLAQLDEITKANKQTKEDNEYVSDFNSQVAPLLKDKFPHISDKELQSVQVALKNHYFDERYLSLTPQEIYTIKANELNELVGPAPKDGPESGKRGVGRGSAADTVDYDAVTEEQFGKMTPEEQDKVIEHRESKSRL